MDRMLENARITLAAACRAQPGESVLIIHSNEGRYPEYAAALERAAWDLKLMPMAINTAPLKSLFKGRKPGELVLPPLKAALEAADITIKIRPGSFSGNTFPVKSSGVSRKITIRLCGLFRLWTAKLRRERCRHSPEPPRFSNLFF